MKNVLVTAAAALIASATLASAVTIAPTSSDGRIGDSVAGARGAATLAYDGDANTFYELDYGETVNFYFAPEVFSNPGNVIEITNGSTDAWDEYITIEVGIDGDAASFETVVPGIISNTVGLGGFTFSTNVLFNVLRITDVTLANACGTVSTPTCVGTDDRLAGFDIAEISVSAVPLPAGGLMLLTALGGLGWARRRKAAS